MSYFIFNHEEPIDIFASCKPSARVCGLLHMIGNRYLETKDLDPTSMRLLLERDIFAAINARELPEMKFSVSFDCQRPIPIYQVTIHEIEQPIVSRAIRPDVSRVEFDYLSMNDFELSDLAGFIKKKLMQIAWRYNADIIAAHGKYGCTHFAYQIAFSPSLLDHQMKRFDAGLRRCNQALYCADSFARAI